MSKEFVTYNGARMAEGWPERIQAAQLETAYTIGGRGVQRVRYGEEHDDWGADQHSCHDCRVIKGQYHVVGCDVEECPVCHGQVLSCDCPYEEPSVARWVQIAVGGLLLLLAVPSIIGCVMLVRRPPAQHPTGSTILGTFMIVLCLVAIEKSVRLVLGWRTRGGLFGPTALRISAGFFFIAPMVGVFTGHYPKFGVIAVGQAVFYVCAGFGLLRLARRRAAGHER